MDVKSILSNPWVWGGGAAIGVVIMLMSNTSKGGSSQAGVIDPNTILSVNELQAGQAQAGMAYQANMAEIAAGLSGRLAELRTSENIAALNTFANMQAALLATTAQQSESAAGVARTRIESQTALAMDRTQQMVRLATSYISADVTKFTTAQEVKKTTIAEAGENYRADLAAQSTNLAAVLGFAGKFV